MMTTVSIDEKLLRKAMSASGSKSKRATVEEAVKLYVQAKGQERLRNLRGRIQWEGNLEEARLSRVAEEDSN